MEAKYTAEDIIKFWFSPRAKPLWFNSTPEFDQELKRTYLDLYQQAESGALDNWRSTATGCVALCILLDQFPLNMFRDQARAFSTEAHSRDVAAFAIEKGFDSQIPDEQKMFLYLPYMHSETLSDQDISVALFTRAGMTENLRYATHHRDIITRFGRFPHRNRALGRECTDEERHYLGSPEAFHG